ncbi:MAG: hypothetical protein IPM35_23665 [Myxococcales bacterium]|nr:hypothetical protein [Myxococcales bacterium]
MGFWSLLPRLFLGLTLALCAIDCVALTPLPPKAPMPAGATWTGKWDTTWGPLELTQSGTRVTGTYQYKSVQGSLTGTMDQNTLVIDWTEVGGAGSGKGQFVMGADGRSFSGTWGTGASATSGGNWTGTRVGEAPVMATSPAPEAAPTGGAPAAQAASPAASPSPGADGVATCSSDGDCPNSTHCKAGRCTAECSTDSHCSGRRCDGARGRCVD